LNVRLSIDLDLQLRADELLGDYSGAIVMINAASGEILVMASHPTFDPNKLDVQAPTLLQDPTSPLLDRVAQGLYSPGDALQPFYLVAGYNSLPSQSIIEQLYIDLGFYITPELSLPVAAASTPGSTLYISPLQMVLAAATLSNDGVRPAPRLAMAVNTLAQGWVILPAFSEPVTVFPSTSTADTAQALMVSGQPFWQWNARVTQGNQACSWSLGGTLPNGQGAPLAVVVLLEEINQNLAGRIGQTLLKAAIFP
jgi:hypothetical protein